MTARKTRRAGFDQQEKGAVGGARGRAPGIHREESETERGAGRCRAPIVNAAAGTWNGVVSRTPWPSGEAHSPHCRHCMRSWDDEAGVGSSSVGLPSRNPLAEQMPFGSAIPLGAARAVSGHRAWIVSASAASQLAAARRTRAARKRRDGR